MIKPKEINMKTKFKVGDKVKIISQDLANWMHIDPRGVYEIEVIYPPNRYAFKPYAQLKDVYCSVFLHEIEAAS